MTELEEAQKLLREAQEALGARQVADRKTFISLRETVRERTTVTTSPRSAAGNLPNFGRTEVTNVDVDQRGLVISASERIKDKGVSIEIVISREAVPDIIAMLLRWPVQ